MRILLVAQNFYPEGFKSNDIAFELAKRGHKVTVLTSLPNYPQGCIYDGYGIFRKRREWVNGVKVYRTLVIPRRKGGGMMLALNYLSWAFCATLWALYLAIFHRYDAILVHQTSPVTQGIPALIVKWLQRKPMYFWVLDLWPESLQAAGNINNKYILNLFSWITTLMYRNSKKILISSKGFKESIVSKGDFENKIVYFPNWAEDVFSSAKPYDIPELPKGFKVMFAGNIGEAQDFDSVMKAALLLKDRKDIKFIIVGDGRKKEWVDEYIRENLLEQTVFMMGRYPIEAMPTFYSQADVMFLALKDEYIFSLTMPAKVQTYMASCKPIIAMINGETRRVIEEVGCGFSCTSGDSNGFAECIVQCKGMSCGDRQQMAQKGFDYFSKHFIVDKCIENLCSILMGGNESPEQQR